MKKGPLEEPPIEPPVTFMLSSAMGWMELGLSEEGVAELEKVPAPFDRHSTVLQLRWVLLQKLGRWNDAWREAQTLLDVRPDMVESWVHCAYAARRAMGGGLEKAREILLKAVKKFPKEIMIPFNLACYECQLERKQAGLQWLEKAIEICPNKKERVQWIKKALEYADLESVQTEVQLWLQREDSEV
jgi:tetratricopeptide (TPR) repeat protein